MYFNIMAPPDRCVAGQSSVMLCKGFDVLTAVHILKSTFSSDMEDDELHTLPQHNM